MFTALLGNPEAKCTHMIDDTEMTFIWPPATETQQWLHRSHFQPKVYLDVFIRASLDDVNGANSLSLGSQTFLFFVV